MENEKMKTVTVIVQEVELVDEVRGGIVQRDKVRDCMFRHSEMTMEQVIDFLLDNDFTKTSTTTSDDAIVEKRSREGGS